MLKMTDAELISRCKDMSKQEVINALATKMDDLQEIEEYVLKLKDETSDQHVEIYKLQQKNEKASKHISHLKLQIKYWQQIADTYKQLLEMERN